jgi:hypothetical protein
VVYFLETLETVSRAFGGPLGVVGPLKLNHQGLASYMVEVLAPTSVEDERTFSALNFIKSDRRSRLLWLWRQPRAPGLGDAHVHL